MDPFEIYKIKRLISRKKRQEEKNKIKSIAYGIENNILQSNSKMARRIYNSNNTLNLINFLNFASATVQSSASVCLTYNTCSCEYYCGGVCGCGGQTNCCGACSSTPPEQCCGNDSVSAGQSCLNGIYYGYVDLTTNTQNSGPLSNSGYVAVIFDNCLNTDAVGFSNEAAATVVMTAFFGVNVGSVTTNPPSPPTYTCGTPAATITVCIAPPNPFTGICQTGVVFPYGYVFTNALIFPNNSGSNSNSFIASLYSQEGDDQNYPNAVKVINNSDSYQFEYIGWDYETTGCN